MNMYRRMANRTFFLCFGLTSSGALAAVDDDMAASIPLLILGLIAAWGGSLFMVASESIGEGK